VLIIPSLPSNDFFFSEGDLAVALLIHWVNTQTFQVVARHLISVRAPIVEVFVGNCHVRQQKPKRVQHRLQSSLVENIMVAVASESC
jgi:hypothetical protein